ncbi:type VI secretion system-associated lipoprotein [Pseudomonas floridensis]|uniref:Type VI secretion system-associated lipoprotein n=1 Tax=Pseudomonas floridensis TaxID=1958950 RepID=A0A1X0MZI1_9PSED|nr:type VI secretion system lipoprotein TssJ [Pseudomonas floridensis]ORC55777.1 type VI secretion system-associated lipoprotein [Pseudomonas floridensis]
MSLNFARPLLLASLMLSGGCSALSPYSAQTRLDISITGSDRLNPDLNGRPSPTVLRLMELKHPAAFQTADFFSLYERGKDALAQDLVATEELELRPGERVDLKLRLTPGSLYVGVLAAYRNLPETRWRYLIQLTPRQLTRAEFTLDEAGLHRSDEAAISTGN